MLTNLGNSASSHPNTSFNLAQPSASGTKTNNQMLKDMVNGVIKAIGTVLSFL